MTYMDMLLTIILIGILTIAANLYEWYKSGRYLQTREWLVRQMGEFTADVLEHPRVQTAMANSIVEGMNRTIEQPDLGERMCNLMESRREYNLKMSRSLGEQLPSMTANLVSGYMSSVKAVREQKQQEKLQEKLEAEKLEAEKKDSAHKNPLAQKTVRFFPKF
eukprot:CAMPEP_0198121844 /NCGR_PEP_ID=MMETSP1442-20131203/33220_1 /TAXON_ID= /ORGANISM="Craspedostauros australis, Strain CCMP3328" /LENGTH=162 /DNA_ID=CAMNT_0043780729 /DNA_START=121 /DNA_END=609 /DNA_ORIENTATION=+